MIRAFCREEQSVEEFEDSSRELMRLNLFVGRISALLNPVTYVLINIATVILIDRAGIQVNMGNMQQGEVVALYNYMLQIINWSCQYIRYLIRSGTYTCKHKNVSIR